MTATAPSRQAGFSLVEVMIAMVITLIVTGAIYGLLSGGESAFRLQPEKTDIQQNGRSAMDMIMRDVSSAGVGMPYFIQTFTQGLDAFPGSPMGVLGPVPQVADELEIVTNQENFPTEDVCFASGTNNDTNVFLMRQNANFTLSGGAPQGVLVFTDLAPQKWAAQQVVGVADNSALPGGAPPPTGPCTGGHSQLTFASGGACTYGAAPTFGSVVSGACTVSQISFGAVVRYRIRPDLTDPTNPMPSLWRLSTSDLAAGYQIVARGIDDMQVQYVQAAAGCTVALPCNPAPQVDPAGVNFGSLITQVRVTLSARSTLKGNLAGQTTISGASALRGQITSTGSPRAALFALTQAAAPQWH